MDSGRKSDYISKLPDCILITIISLLPFKELVRTIVLSKRWKNLCRETRNLVFKESEFVNLSETEETIKIERVLFIRIICQWILEFTGKSIEKFELCLSKPIGFEAEITSLVEFAALRQVKNLILDFSNPESRRIGVIEHLLTLFYYQNNKLDFSHIFFNLLYVRNLTICSLFVQMIQDFEDPMELHDPMKTKHLTMKINMHTNEFDGIMILLNSCPDLESLTFDMVTTERIVRTTFPIDPETYWLTQKTYECLEKTLKVVEVKNFRSDSNELHVLQYLIRTGRVIERLDLYEAKGLNHGQRRLVLAQVEEIQRYSKKASRPLRITLHNV